MGWKGRGCGSCITVIFFCGLLLQWFSRLLYVQVTFSSRWKRRKPERVDNRMGTEFMLVAWVMLLAVGLGVAFGADPPAECGRSGGTSVPGIEQIGCEPELQCRRPLIDVNQGFAVTLLSTAVGVWSRTKAHGVQANPDTGRWFVGLLAPLAELPYSLQRSCFCVLILWKLGNFRDNGRAEEPHYSVRLKRLFKALLPWNKSPARLLASCNVVMYTLRDSALTHTCRGKSEIRQVLSPSQS